MRAQSPHNIQERTFQFGVGIIRMMKLLPRSFTGQIVGRQLLRAGTSIRANMEEAKGAESHNDFIHKTAIAYKEARETHYWLGLIEASILNQHPEVLALRKESDELIRILHAILRKARQSKH